MSFFEFVATKPPFDPTNDSRQTYIAVTNHKLNHLINYQESRVPKQALRSCLKSPT